MNGQMLFYHIYMMIIKQNLISVTECTAMWKCFDTQNLTCGAESGHSFYLIFNHLTIISHVC